MRGVMGMLTPRKVRYLYDKYIVDFTTMLENIGIDRDRLLNITLDTTIYIANQEEAESVGFSGGFARYADGFYTIVIEENNQTIIRHELTHIVAHLLQEERSIKCGLLAP
jgi:hypothetical protein